MDCSKLIFIFKVKGVWRAEIESSPNEIIIYVPKTSLNRAKEIAQKEIPIAIKHHVREIKNPLKLKKFSYFIKRNMPSSINSVTIEACFSNENTAPSLFDIG